MVAADAVLVVVSLWVLRLRVPIVRPKPPELIKPEVLFCSRCVSLWVLVAASMLTLRAASSAVPWLLAISLPLTLISCPLCTLTRLPDNSVPCWVVWSSVWRELVVVRDKKPRRVWRWASSTLTCDSAVLSTTSRAALRRISPDAASDGVLVSVLVGVLVGVFVSVLDCVLDGVRICAPRKTISRPAAISTAPAASMVVAISVWRASRR